MKLNNKEKIFAVTISVVFVLILILVNFNQTELNSPPLTSSETNNPTVIPTSAFPDRELPVYEEEPTPTSTYIKLNVSFKLPVGWVVSKEKETVFENFENDVYTLTSGEYKLIVGRGSTGRAYCNIKADRRNYVPLFNNLLGSQVFRDNPRDYSSTHLSVCANVVNPEEIEDGTKIGHIVYELPADWTENKLREMDSIVESIRRK